MDRNISLALTRIETWLGLDNALSPELFVVSDILRNICTSEDFDVQATCGHGMARIWFARQDNLINHQWLWMLELTANGLMLRIRTTAPTTDGKTFLANLMGQVYSLRDAMQLIEWWDTKAPELPVAISSYLPQDPEAIVQIIEQLEVAMREGANQ